MRALRVYLLLATTTFQLPFGVAAIAIASNIGEAPLCGSSSYLPLTSWLLGFGVFSIITFSFSLPIFCGLPSFPRLALGWFIVTQLFDVIWMIVGSVALFHFDVSCRQEAYPLWACAMACVVQYYVRFGLLYFVGSCLCGCCFGANADDSKSVLLPFRGLMLARAIIFQFAFGVAALVVHTVSATGPPINCSLNAHPQLPNWLFGFGISNLICLGISFPLICAFGNLPDRFALAWFVVVEIFDLVWMIVGSVALFAHGSSCQTLAYPIWACTMACVIQYYVRLGVSIIVASVCCCMCTDDHGMSDTSIQPSPPQQIYAHSYQRVEPSVPNFYAPSHSHTKILHSSVYSPVPPPKVVSSPPMVPEPSSSRAPVSAHVPDTFTPIKLYTASNESGNSSSRKVVHGLSVPDYYSRSQLCRFMFQITTALRMSAPLTFVLRRPRYYTEHIHNRF